MATPRETIGVKIPPEWKARIQAIAQQQGITPSQWLYGLIGDALGEPSESSVNPTVNPVNPSEERLSAVEDAIASLGEQIADLAQRLERMPSINPAERVTHNTPAATPTPFPRPETFPAGEWLKLPEAFLLAKSRGYPGETENSFRNWVKRNPQPLAHRYGLEWHGQNNKSNSKPTYKDLWFARD